jgi:hypothetical protein
MNVTVIPRVSNIALPAFTEEIYKEAKRNEVYSFCGMWTTAEAKDFEKRIEDFELIDTQDWQK